jgi:Tol biopolymer transport system component
VIGKRLGPYEITAKLGEGGMGEVYQANDSRLKRAVAIKVLPPAFTSDPERLARFEREAQLLAQLHHPNIAAIYGLEESDGIRALVMELVEGEDLSAVIARGPLALGEAVAIARQVADALEAAHGQGIVHRDLKPGNIKVSEDGAVKVLDFGLAKAMAPAATSSADAMHSPTLTARATQLGIVLGTAAYMAPEQAKGRSVDQRADIWAFGAVLYEMLTGQRAFAGDDISEVLASVLKTEPEWQTLPAELPASMRRLLRRCLVKDPHKRLSSIGDARLELEEQETPVAAAAAVPASPRSVAARLWPLAAGIVVAALVAGLLWPPARPAGVGLSRLSIVAPPGSEIYPDSVQSAISPDGRMVAFVVGSLVKRAGQLWVRPLDSLVARRLEGGDGGELPFWSPDSRSIAFVAGGKLKVLTVATGRTEVLCDSRDTRGGAWSPTGVIVFTPDANGPLFRVSANGGEPVAVTALDPARKESGHRFPVFLPDGERFLYATVPAHGGRFDIFAGSLRDSSRTLVASLESAPVYAEPGWLLFSRHGSLAAQRFDAGKLKLIGEAVTLEDEPGVILDNSISFTAGRPASVSATGALAYFSFSSNRMKVAWLDDSGAPTAGPDLPLGHYTQIAVSPRGTQAAIVRAVSATESEIRLWDLDHRDSTPLSKGPGLNEHPVWSPDGSRVVFGSDRRGPVDLFMKDVTDASPERPFYRAAVTFMDPFAWSPDGKWIAVSQLDPETLQNIYLLPTGGEVKLKTYLVAPGRDEAQAISPDGKWMTYLAEDTGASELYAQSFPVPGHKVRISTGGAGGLEKSWWTPDQRHILYVDPASTSLMIVDVEAGETLRVSAPRVKTRLPPGIVALDAMPDRKRWVALVRDSTAAGSLTVVQNWTAAVKN